MSVFTTQTLLNSVGVSRNRATPAAVAINWILKVCLVLIQMATVSAKFDNVLCVLVPF